MDAALRIGLTPWRYDAAAPASLLVEQALLAERLGFHSFWLPESHFAGPSSNPAPLLLLAAMAAATQRIRLATTSYLLPVRHPIQAAEEVAVLDCLSGGRLILGVGRGFRRALFAAYDLPVGEKRDRFETALAIMRDAWEGKPVAVDPSEGGVLLSPLPVQRPHPPIWAAAFGPKALALSGRLGLPYLCSPIEPFAQLQRNHATHRAALVESLGEVELAVPVMRTVFAHRDGATLARVRAGLEQQAQRMARTAPRSLRRLAAERLEDWALVGEPAQVEDEIARYREALGITHLIARTQIPGAEERDTFGALEHLAELQAQAGDATDDAPSDAGAGR